MLGQRQTYVRDAGHHRAGIVRSDDHQRNGPLRREPFMQYIENKTFAELKVG